ncbi:bifunctional phosphoribosylaminoimidazolecarboxamide formyltransferase/IMP cyclohydrolase [SAR202 cluster bacterium AC-647-N09_OGT_505m]|nr:bifunctional phosphoribosylaminoimidazolecarboxamide formyltransferase/IMP cyclohydrolase [SAR202 cluster bacterium AC-647-N09_OGT_505m]
MKALLSVYDKTGVVEFARSLQGMGMNLVSTGGTHQALSEAGLPVQQVSDLTGSPEILDGRVKTLHPIVHGGILARRDKPEHVSELTSLQMDTIDLVAVNLYPFAATIARPGVSLDDALENIDIGGPTMIRAAAKNFPFVTVVVNPTDYPWVVERMADGGLTIEERQRLAYKAFQHVALYDTIIAQYLRNQNDDLGQELTLGYSRLYDLRYGENPHQQAAFYGDSFPSGIAGAKQLHGKELSFNNILDADAAWRAVADFREPAAAVIKHTNTCGLACHQDQAEAYRRAFSGDPVSAFGGIVAFNRLLTREAAEAMRQVFYEIVIAPAFEPSALEILKKKRDLRILALGDAGVQSGSGWEVRQVSGGVLMQTPDILEEDPQDWEVVTERKPTQEEFLDLAFAWRAVKHVKSNAIVVVKGQALLGMGAGQPNRIISVQLSLKAAGEASQGAVLASDAFFPFADGVEAAAEGGITAVVQPGGSIRDGEVIDAANRLGLAMVVTGVRHFRH